MAAAAYHTSLIKAIQSLDSLNDQIVQYIFTPRDVTLDLDRELSSHEQETLRSSMLLIRRLLMDAQSKFRKMVEDNKQLAARIDGSIHAANQEVNALRAELADTNKRLTQISNGSPKSAKENLLPLAFQGNDCNPTNLVFGALCYRELGSAEMLNSADQYPIKNPNQMMIKSNITTTQFSDLSEQNLKLKLQVSNLRQELEELQKAQAAKSHLQQQTSFGEMKLEVIQTKRDLSRAKEALQALKADRKRLKAEKLELLNQLKQLYGTLENKETELREFIWKYERHMAENEENIKKMASEKEDVEREKWEIIKRAREAAERSVILQSKLDSKEKLVQRMQSDLNELRKHFSSICQTRASVTSDVFEKLTNSTNERQSIDEFPSLETNGTEKSTNEKNSKVPNNNPASTNEGESKSESTLMNFLSSSQEILDNEIKQQKKKKSFGSLTKIFSKSRNRRSMALTSESELEDSNSCTLPRLSLLSPENHQEKLELVEQLKKIPMSEWKANQVLAWLELHLAMPFYGQMCCDNIKSGKVLLGLSDSELSSALGITNPIHRRKLRLAIDEHRDFIEIKYPKASELDHNWVCQTWLNDIGLPQYKKTFESQLVDGRMLNTISKKDMEKHFGIHRKFHQASFLHAVELLKTVNFDKEVLRKRREKCADQNVDPIVWNSERLIKWVKSIDLKEYADNLKESGVHGALIVLEPLFNADTLATALGIPPSKSYVRRHLISELDALIKPARANMDVRIISKKKTNGGSLGRSFPRSFRTNNDDFTPKSRMSIRGSIGKAFGRRNLRPVFDSKDSSDADTPTHTKQNRLEPVTTPPPPSCDLDFSSTTV